MAHTLLRTLCAIERSYRVLFVCTANQCRSPMAAAMLERRMVSAGVAGTVESAGTRASGAWPATADATAAAQEMGLDLTGHVSKALDRAAVASADLIIGLAREHAREAVSMEPTALTRTFTFKDLVRRGEALPRGDQPFSDWLAWLAAGRSREQLLGTSPRDDVADPTGRSFEACRKTAAELDELAAGLVQIAWPIVPRH